MGEKRRKQKNIGRRTFLKGFFGATAATAVSGCGTDSETWESIEAFLQSNFREMSKEELKATLKRLEKRYSRKFGKSVIVKATPPLEGTFFAYALDISRCIGCRRCVYGCVDENNQSRKPQVHWIRVLEMEKDKGVDFDHANAYYDPKTVPEEGKFYIPVACQQCKNPPCVKVCPVGATWKEQDGIVVVDYDWCVGCRCCITACPYGARHFNWKEPSIPPDQLNTKTEYLGNRPRLAGVVEKCTFCLQRVRNGKYPKCNEVCPVGARKFGNLLDPNGEIRRILETKRVFVLKEELNTEPKFYYFYGT